MAIIEKRGIKIFKGKIFTVFEFLGNQFFHFFFSKKVSLALSLGCSEFEQFSLGCSYIEMFTEATGVAGGAEVLK